MKDILLCSSDALLVKNLYGFLRDLGFNVETVEHPAHAVRRILLTRYDLAIVDTEPFGLSAGEAAEIIRSVAPDMPIYAVGTGSADDHSALRAFDLEALTRTMHEFAV